jgi:hypothetical protein
MNMKTLALTFVVVSGFSGVAFADGFAGDHQAPYRFGQTDNTSVKQISDTRLKDSYNTQALASPEQEAGTKWYSGRYGLTTDPMDIRRWDEKND